MKVLITSLGCIISLLCRISLHLLSVYLPSVHCVTNQGIWYLSTYFMFVCVWYLMYAFDELIFLYYRVRWDRYRALQLFIEHIVLNHPMMPIAYLRRLQLVSKYILKLFTACYILVYFCVQFLGSETDFLSANTLGKVQRHLNTTVKEAKRKK